MNALIWNIRSVNSMEAFTRLIQMQNKYHFGFIWLMEPFQEVSKLENYRRRIGLQHALANCSRKIWVFIDDIFEFQILSDHVQQLSLKLKVIGTQEEMVITLVYAKCTQRDKMDLWESLEDMAPYIQLPWLIGGDFNTIVSDAEKYGGLPVTISEIQDFRACIQSYGMTDLGFKGSTYTWWNGQSREYCIFKRLDRCLGNQDLQDKYPGIEINHLIRTGSDHAPILISYSRNVEPV
ncbi:uncharacterized protein LOC132639671 [Lycium barbarum]|uniref:uncharacterized protein LOC132639671 n=1 Tax=Lycium barbarum TaxID=112863 RepID=UPI00293EA9AF|nr:uncharacterized protein LOC132639671 [Lycium barbarum]